MLASLSPHSSCFLPLWSATSIGRLTLGFNNLSFISSAHYATIYNCLSVSLFCPHSHSAGNSSLPYSIPGPQFYPLSWLVIFSGGFGSFLLWTGHESIRTHCLSAAPAFALSGLGQPGYLLLSVCCLTMHCCPQPIRTLQCHSVLWCYAPFKSLPMSMLILHPDELSLLS